MPLGVVAGLIYSQVIDPWITFSSGQLNLVWCIAMGHTYGIFASSNDLSQQLTITGVAWGGYIAVLREYFVTVDNTSIVISS